MCCVFMAFEDGEILTHSGIENDTFTRTQSCKSLLHVSFAPTLLLRSIAIHT
jgi:hypothetical protein